MCFSKKKYVNNVSHDNEFLKDYAVKVNGLLIYAEENEKVKKELGALRDDFQYAVASASEKAKAIEKTIAKDFETLVAALQQPEWDEAEVLLMVKGLRRNIVEITSLR